VLTDTGAMYSWEALQGVTLQAILLRRAGYEDPFAWSDRALLRSVAFLSRNAALPATYSVDHHVTWIINHFYGVNYPTKPAGSGRLLGFTDWLFGPGASVAVPTTTVVPATATTTTTTATTAAPTTTLPLLTATTVAAAPTTLAAPTTITTVGPTGGTQQHGIVGPKSKGVLSTAWRPAVFDTTTARWTIPNGLNPPSTFYFGNPGDLPMLCDWNGDGTATVGLFRPSDGFVYFRNTNTFGIAEITFYYGQAGDIPLCGDWDGDGKAGIGVFRPAEATFYLRDKASLGFADYVVTFGIRGDQPIAGDWDGNGRFSPGVYRPSTNRFMITNSIDAKGGSKREQAPILASTDAVWVFGLAGDLPVAGDWNADGITSLGVFRRSVGRFYLAYTVNSQIADELFQLGDSSSLPVAGPGL